MRERRADIPMLVENIVRRYAAQCGYDEPPDIHPDLMHALANARWPGNLRELDGTLHAMMLLAAGAKCLTLGHCFDDHAHLADEKDRPQPKKATPEQVHEALLRCGGNKSEAARILSVDRKTIRRRMQQGG